MEVRPLNDWEVAVLRRLALAPDWADREARVTVTEHDASAQDYLFIAFATPAGQRPHATALIHLRGSDSDGADLVLTVGTRDGWPCDLEVLRGDGEPIQALPDPTTLTVVQPR